MLLLFKKKHFASKGQKSSHPVLIYSHLLNDVFNCNVHPHSDQSIWWT